MKIMSIFVGLLFLSFGCSSDGDDGAADRYVRVTYGAPVELSSLQNSQKNVAIKMTKLSEAEETELELGEVLQYDEANNYYANMLLAVPPGRYAVKLYLSYPNTTIAAGLLDVALAEYEATGGIPLAVFETTIDVVVGQEEIIIDIAPQDFSLNLDSDMDGRDNAKEVIEQTNPYVADNSTPEQGDTSL